MMTAVDWELVGTAVAMAVFVATAVTAIVEYLKGPLVETPKVKEWMVRVGLAYENGEHVVMWWMQYVTFGISAGISYGFGIDLVTPFIPTAPGIGAKLLTAAIVGGGAKIIHDVTRKE